MGTRGGTSSVLPLIGFMLLWPHVLTNSVSSTLQHVDSVSVSPGTDAAVSGHGGERPLVVKGSTQSCNSTYDGYCLNGGRCILLVDINEHHCICDAGFYGYRCAYMDFVGQSAEEKEIIVIIFCVCLLITGLAGALYFCCKWYKKNAFSSQQKQPSTGGVRLV